MLLFFLVAFLASTIGAICGIGGGVIIKPVLDSLHLGSAATVNFLSGCTVLSMSLYSVCHAAITRSRPVDTKSVIPLCIGASVGGVCGRWLFQIIRGQFADQNRVSAVQAACLAAITLGTLLYELNKRRIRTRHTRGVLPCVAIGLALGIMSSFLGIGGGPINLVVLFYFFSMDTKTAATSSLYIILFSQALALLTTLLTGTVPEFEAVSLLAMIAGGIGGGILGRALNRHIQAGTVDKLFTGLMAVIILICIYNIWRYAF